MKNRLDAALEGNLEAFMAEELDLAEVVVTEGIIDTSNRLKARLRADVVAGGLGRRLSKSWQSKTYPETGQSLGAASLIFTKAPQLIRAFEEGAVIKSANGRFIAVPTDVAPKKGADGKRLSPSNFPVHRFGELRFVPRARGYPLLVVDNLRSRKGKRGGFARASKRALRTGEGLTTVPMFTLVPQVRLRRRLKVSNITRSAAADLARAIEAGFSTRKRRKLR
ncbi:DUF6441 family protein [Salipiger abyssi]|uniref:DUF6441 family protein n=1 Tax=Salipiger abyssi TaxID=1250539 RepID=UPI00405A1459